MVSLAQIVDITRNTSLDLELRCSAAGQVLLCNIIRVPRINHAYQQIAKLVVYEQYAEEAYRLGLHTIVLLLMREIMTSKGRDMLRQESMLISNVSILRRIIQSKPRLKKVNCHDY